MRPAVLFALLPLLATNAIARPHQSGHDHSVHKSHRIRKSLSFGPIHKHASFEVAEEPELSYGFLAREEVDIHEVAKRFIGEKVGVEEGKGFYIREDVNSFTRIYTYSERKNE